MDRSNRNRSAPRTPRTLALIFGYALAALSITNAAAVDYVGDLRDRLDRSSVDRELIGIQERLILESGIGSVLQGVRLERDQREQLERSFVTVQIDALSRQRNFAQVGARIILGQGGRARDGEFPSMVALVAKHPETGNYRVICGGTVATSRHVLTAAHCDVISTSYLYVYTGGASLDLSPSNLKRVKKVIRHPDFEVVRNEGREVGLRNDVAVIVLETPTAHTPVRLAPPSPEGDALYVPSNPSVVTGWGVTNTLTQETSNELLFGRVKVRAQEECSAAYGEVIDSTQVCAGAPQTDSCWGDSGGPLFAEQEGHVQIGIVSYGYGCAVAQYPGVYARVSVLRTFIDEAISRDPR